MYIDDSRYREALEDAFVKEAGKKWEAIKTIASIPFKATEKVVGKAWQTRSDVKAAKKRAGKEADKVFQEHMAKEHMKDPSLRKKELALSGAKALVGGGAIAYGTGKAVDKATGTSPSGNYRQTRNYPVYVA